MNGKILVFLAFVLQAFCVLAISDTIDDIGTLSWKKGEEPAIGKPKVHPEVIASFLNSKLPDNWFDISPKEIGDYRWVDINADKDMEFFVVTAPSRGFFTQLFIFTSSGREKTFLQKEHVWNLNNLDLAIKDLDKDGYYELLLPQELSFYRTAGAMPIWTAVYRWRQGKFMRADSEYIDFYKDKLPSVEFKIDEIRKQWEAENAAISDPATLDDVRSHYERLLALQIILRDKMLRLIGPDSKAGYKQAIQWAKSQDPEMRENAIVVFKDIYDESSRKQLQILAKDNDTRIARKARSTIDEKEHD